MSRRRWTVPLLMVLAACTADVGAGFRSAEQIPSDPTAPGPTPAPTPAPTSSTPGTRDPQFTLPPAPTGPEQTSPTTSTPSSGSNVPRDTAPTTTQASPPSGTTPGEPSDTRPSPTTATRPTTATGPTSTTGVPADLPMPDDCVPMPQDAPALLVTTGDGALYEVSVGGTQQIATSDGLPGLLGSAWRASDGTLWVSLRDVVTSTVGRLDNGEFTESGTGSLQHVGEIDGEPVALWIERPSLGDDGRIVIEDGDGTQGFIAPATDGGLRAATGGIGGDRVAVHFTGPGMSEDFRYYTGDGTERDDWFDPAETGGNDQAIERSGPTPGPDGERLAWLERSEGGAASGPDFGSRVAIADLPRGGDRDVVEIADTDEAIRTFDYDGRWYAASIRGVGAGLIDRVVLVDTEAERPQPIVPCVPMGTVSIDRSGGGESDGGSPDSTPDSGPGGRGSGPAGPGGIDP